jgi:hypothetical protein
MDREAFEAFSLEYGRETDGVVVTTDAKDFARGTDHPGVIVVPQTGLTPGDVAAGVSRMERLVTNSGLTGSVAEWISERILTLP